MQLNLQNNQLTGGIPSLNLPKLRYLDLSRNKISDISEFSQSKLPSLLQLDISYNNLEVLPLLSDTSLEVYNFNHNKIKSLSKGKSSMLHLTHIYGSHNQIEGAITLALSNKVKVMILNYNRILGKEFSLDEKLDPNHLFVDFEVFHMEGNAYSQ